MKIFKSKRSTNAHPARNRKFFGIGLIGFTLLVLGGFVLRFSFVATIGEVDSNNLAKQRQKQYQTDTVLQAQRGAILDRSGNVIAEDSNTYTIYAILDKQNKNGDKPDYVTNKAKTAKILSRYLAIGEDKVLARLNPSKNLFQVEFGRPGTKLSLAIKKQIEAEKLPGIHFRETPSRLYPNGVFASHVIGLAQAQDNGGGLTGVMGLEKQFNTVLTGTNGYRRSETDAYGYKLPNAKTKAKAPVNGGSVYTTLDSGLQAYLETLMTDVQTKYEPKGMTAVLMNAKTGRILAATQRPTFDASTGEGLGDMWRDSLVEDNYEPGSVMKIMTLAAAIQSGKYHPNEYFQSGSVKLDGGTVNDWRTGGWGSIPLSKAFPLSSNVGMVKIEQEMGAGIWKSYLDKFKFGQKTGITLPGETSGRISFQRPLDQASTAFGQGIEVTVMQMMQAISAVANDGKMLKPQIVSKVVNKNGKATVYKPEVVGQPISKETAARVIDAMRHVVNDEDGTGVAYKMPGVDLAVKTGTGQIASAQGGYLTGDSNYTFSVAGIAPASNPKYVLYVAMKQPQKMTEPAESILASIFKPMMQRALDTTANSTVSGETNTAEVPAVTNAALASAQDTVKKAGFDVATIGTGNKIVQQLPASGTKALRDSRVLLLTNGAMTMPDLTGWSKSDVLKFVQLTGKKFKLVGDGFVVRQSIAKGTLLGNASGTIEFKQQ